MLWEYIHTYCSNSHYFAQLLFGYSLHEEILLIDTTMLIVQCCFLHIAKSTGMFRKETLRKSWNLDFQSWISLPSIIMYYSMGLFVFLTQRLVINIIITVGNVTRQSETGSQLWILSWTDWQLFNSMNWRSVQLKMNSCFRKT